MSEIKKPELVDAYDMNQRHPETFEIPTLDEIKAIKPGDFVKVCAGDKERFWVIVESIEGDRIIGEINNELIFPELHGLKMKDKIELQTLNIYSILDGKEMDN